MTILPWWHCTWRDTVATCVRATDLLLFDQIYDCLGLLLSFDFDLHDMSSAANLYVP